MKWSDKDTLSIHLDKLFHRGDRTGIHHSEICRVGRLTHCTIAVRTLWREARRANVWIRKSNNGKIAIAACEQCRRNVVPEIRPLMKLQDWCAENDGALKLNLHPELNIQLKTYLLFQKEGVRLLIGSEGGLSPRNRSN